ncbi:MAG TPA: ATP-binding protein [Gammaproteobacteria bacterium]
MTRLSTLLKRGRRRSSEERLHHSVIERLRTPTDPYRRFFESIDAGFAVLEVLFDEAGRPVDHRFLETNEAFARHTGLTDAVGKRALELAPDHEREWFQVFGRVVTSGEPMHFEAPAAALCGRWFDVYAFPFGEPGDNQVAILFSDVTDRKNMEQALRDSEERFRLLVESAAQAVWEADPEGGFVQDSPSWRAYTGQSAADAAGFGWLEAVHPDHREHAGRRWREAALKRTRLSEEWCLRSASGGWRWAQVHAAPVLDDRGRVRKWVVMVIDIDARKEAEAERDRIEAALREADRRKDEFLATLAHELRNPLAPIRNGLQILKLTTPMTASAERTAAMMERQMSHLVRLVDDLLDVSRISRGKVALRKTRVVLDEVIAAALESNWPQIDAKRLDFSAAIADESIEVSGDPDRLTQVFANLLSNAVKFSEPGGRVWLRLERHGAQAVVSVRDTGAGIPPGALSDVFEMFSQLQTDDRRSAGLGIGLAIARELVLMHGGTLEARSEGIGRGSEFIVRLPVLEPALPADGKHEPAAAAGAPLRHLSVLVADDNEDALATLAHMLELAGHRVHTAHDGLQALEAARALSPDVALLDIGMPGLDGNEVARRIRELPRGKDVLLVALTGWGQEEDKRRSSEAGFDAHLTKPVDPGVLLRVISGNRGGPRRNDAGGAGSSPTPPA